MSFEADTFDHQHAVTQQPLNPLLLELLQEVGAVAGQAVHGHSAAGPLTSNFSIKKLAKGTHSKKRTTHLEVIYYPSGKLILEMHPD